MPVQEEAITARPSEDVSRMPGLSSLEPDERRLIDQWKRYNANERAVLRKYQGRFAGDIKKASEDYKAVTEAFNKHIETFWDTVGDYTEQSQAFLAHSSKGHRKGARQSMLGLAESAVGARDKARKELGRLSPELPKWRPPRMAPSPESKTGSVRGASIAQETAITSRSPLSRPTESMYSGIGDNEGYIKERIQRGMSGVKESGITLRADAAARYNAMIAEQTGKAKGFRKSATGALRLAEGFDPIDFQFVEEPELIMDYQGKLPFIPSEEGADILGSGLL